MAMNLQQNRNLALAVRQRYRLDGLILSIGIG
jgi:hypothetical protein